MRKKIIALLALLATSFALAAVDVNKATEAELDSVKGIGPGTTRVILAERKKAPFKDWDDFISRVKGVGEARATSLSDAGLTVGGTGYQAPAAGKKAERPAKAGTPVAKKDPKDARNPAAAAAKPAANAASSTRK
jgi:competence protein ComEA